MSNDLNEFDMSSIIWYNIIGMGIHYSSQYRHYEDEPKNSLKSISVKLLVFASCAQLGVDAGNEEFMGGRNGIRATVPSIRGDPTL